METKKNIYKALADFQSDCPVIHKGTKGFNYTYTNLTDILKVVNPLLKKHGLGFTQILQGTFLNTVLFHTKSGETIEGSAEIPQNVTLNKMNQFQVMGSAITYYRRYALSSMLGIVTDADLDACGEQVTVEPKEEIPCDEDKEVLKQLVYNSTLGDDAKTEAFKAIRECPNYDMYTKIQNKLEGMQLGHDDVANPNAGDIKRKVKEMADKPNK